MTDRKRLQLLLEAEATLKNTKAGYTPTGPNWRSAMPKLWKVRVDLGSSELGQDLAVAHGLLKDTEKGYDPRAPRWREAMLLIDRVEDELHDDVPVLGPIVAGGKS